MKKSFGTKMKVLALSALTAVASSTFTSCQNEIAEENRFTFTGELIADHLKKHPERYSHFCTILKQAKFGKKGGDMLTVLSTYGSYTCFAPSNEGIEQYLLEKFTEWDESRKQYEAGLDVKIKHTGITSPYLEDLSDSMATVIARNHILEKGITTDEVGIGAFPKKTMNRRNIMLGWIEDKDTKERKMAIEGIKILEDNIETENGYIHYIEKALAPSDQGTADLLASQPGFSLFNDALRKTGLDEYLSGYELDSNYDGLGKVGPKFVTENNQTPPYPESYIKGFTLLVETDSLLADPENNELGIEIKSIDDLEYFAAHYYGTNFKKEEKIWDYQVAFAEERDEENYKNPNNPLYKFIAYHIIDRRLLYSSGKSTGGFLMENYLTENDKKEIDNNKFNSEVNMPRSYDRYDYFETALPYTMIKVTKPFSNLNSTYRIKHDETKEVVEDLLNDQLVINYAQEMGSLLINKIDDKNGEKNNTPMRCHINVVIEDESTTRQYRIPDFQSQAMNGMIYTINKILVYNEEEMTGNILQERMRWDVFSLFPELTNNDVRWVPEDSEYTLTYIPENYCSRLRHNNTDTQIYYLRPHQGNWAGGYANYQGDEMLVTGKYDFQYRIPYVPEGSYEIRFGFSTSDSRGVAQFYFGKEGKLEICGIPLDMRNSNRDFFGWEEESDNEEENRRNDKAMRNRGFMKAPASIELPGSGGPKSMRYTNTAMRRIIGIHKLEKNESYWLRFKDVTEGGTESSPNQFNQDYLEIIPIEIVNNQNTPEDIY